MSEELPPDWALNEAVTRSEGSFTTWAQVCDGGTEWAKRYVIAHARTIAKHEPEPVDPDLVKAREIAASTLSGSGHYMTQIIEGKHDNAEELIAILAGIKWGKEHGGVS